MGGPAKPGSRKTRRLGIPTVTDRVVRPWAVDSDEHQHPNFSPARLAAEDVRRAVAGGNADRLLRLRVDTTH